MNEKYQAPSYLGERDLGRHGYTTPSIEDVITYNDGLFQRSEEVESFLNHPDMNFDVLKEIFDEHVKKSGGIEAQIVPKGRILKEVSLTSNIGEVGGYYADIKVIAFADTSALFKGVRAGIEPHYAEGVRGFDMTNENLVQMEILMNLIHEEWHAVSGQHNFIPSFPAKRSSQIGFQRRNVYPILGDLTTGFLINEGFTQMMTYKTLEEYVRRIGTFHGVNEAGARKFVEIRRSEFNRIKMYEEEVQVVSGLVCITAKLLNWREEEVLNSFTRAYLHGSSVFSKELEEQFVAAGKGNEYNIIQTVLNEHVSNYSTDSTSRLSKVKTALINIDPNVFETLKSRSDEATHIIPNDDERPFRR